MTARRARPSNGTPEAPAAATTRPDEPRFEKLRLALQGQGLNLRESLDALAIHLRSNRYPEFKTAPQKVDRRQRRLVMNDDGETQYGHDFAVISEHKAREAMRRFEVSMQLADIELAAIWLLDAQSWTLLAWQTSAETIAASNVAGPKAAADKRKRERAAIKAFVVRERRARPEQKQSQFAMHIVSKIREEFGKSVKPGTIKRWLREAQPK